MNATTQININMRCIEKKQSERFWCNEHMININMRCIEIILVHYSLLIVAGLTLTWDVLKSNVSSLVPSFRLGININMRCIEIIFYRYVAFVRYGININMRCIEIIAFYTLYRCHRAININMRCIEMPNLPGNYQVPRD